MLATPGAVAADEGDDAASEPAQADTDAADTEEPAATGEPAEAPATEEPATEEPAEEPTATEEPATEEPAEEPTATEEPATEEPAEELTAQERSDADTHDDADTAERDGADAAADRADGDAADEEERVVLPQVQVIGTADDLSDLPASGQVVDGEEIRRHGYDDINRALRNVPGVYLREEDGFGMFPNISLRGVDHGRSSKVTLMEDGIMQAPAPYSAPAAYYSPTTARMSGLEVLKGTSQVRYGPHTTGGVINYQSTPIPFEREGYARFGIGSFDLTTGSFDEARGHVYHGETFETDAGNFGYLLEAYERRNRGFKTIGDSFTDGGLVLMENESTNTGMRGSDYVGKVMWEPPTDRHQRLELMVGYAELNSNESYMGITDEDFDDDPFRRYSTTRLDDVFTEQQRASLRHFWDISDTLDVNTTAYYTSFNRSWNRVRGHLEDGDGNIIETLDEARDVCDDGSCSNVRSAVSLVDEDAVGILQGRQAGVLNYRFNNRDYYTLGVQSDVDGAFDTGPLTHDWSLGARYHRDEIDRFQRQDAYEQDDRGFFVEQQTAGFGETNPATGIFPGDRVQEAQAYSIFADNAMTLGRWTVTPGARFEHIDVGWTDRVDGESFDDSLNVFAGSLATSFQFTPQTFSYGGVHQGYSVPDPRGIIRDDVEEETSLSFELGQRYNTSDGAFMADIGLFYTDFDDLVETPNLGAGFEEDAATQNVGDITTAGVELQLAYDLGIAQQADWSLPLSLVATYTQAEIDGDVATDSPGSIFSGAQDGNDVPYIPDLQFKLGAGFQTGPYSLAADVIYQDEMFGTADNAVSPQETQLPAGRTFGPDARQGRIESHWIVDISGEYDLSETATAFVNVHNLADQEYMVSRLPQGPRPGKPRTFVSGIEAIF